MKRPSRVTLQRLLVDPFLLSRVHLSTSSAIEGLIDNLDAIRNLDRWGVRSWFSPRCVDALWQDGHFPSRKELRHIVARYQIPFADANTLASLIQVFCERYARLDGQSPSGEMLFNSADVEVEPEWLISRLGQCTGTAFVEAMVRAVWDAGGKTSDNATRAVLLSTGHNQPDDRSEREKATKAHVRGRSICLATDEAGTPAKTIDAELDMVAECKKLALRIEAHNVWRSATSSADYKAAIELRVWQLTHTEDAARRQIDRFALGKGFVATLQRWECHSTGNYGRNVLEACARLVAGRPKSTEKRFRVDVDPSSRQRVRSDGASAWRTQITKSGTGLRLMYWRFDDGTIEFANVGSKHELRIE